MQGRWYAIGEWDGNHRVHTFPLFNQTDPSRAPSAEELADRFETVPDVRRPDPESLLVVWAENVGQAEREYRRRIREVRAGRNAA